MQWYALADDTIKPLDETDAIRGRAKPHFFLRGTTCDLHHSIHTYVRASPPRGRLCTPLFSYDSHHSEYDSHHPRSNPEKCKPRGAARWRADFRKGWVRRRPSVRRNPLMMPFQRLRSSGHDVWTSRSPCQARGCKMRASTRRWTWKGAHS